MIKADKAAKISAEVASKGIEQVLPRQPPGKWPPGIFCDKLKTEMEVMFKKDHEKLGVRVSQWK